MVEAVSTYLLDNTLESLLIAHKERIVDITRGWLGTPYHHQASVRGVGTDCFGLIRGVWRELYAQALDPETMPPYSWDWAEAKNEETMLAGARRHMEEIPVLLGPGDCGIRLESRGMVGAGDVLLFRYRDGYNAKHAGILTGGDRMIHASYDAVCSEVHLGDWWYRHAAGAFRFPLTQK